MNFWLTRPLVRKLAANQVNDQLGMQYFLASTLLVLTQTQLSLWWGARTDWLFYFEFFALAAIAYFGCISCWKANNGRDFALRAICLSVPAGIRVFVIGLIFGLFMRFNAESIFDYQTFSNPGRAYDIVSYAFFIGINIYFWVVLHQGMSQITTSQSSSEPAS